MLLQDNSCGMYCSINDKLFPVLKRSKISTDTTYAESLPLLCIVCAMDIDESQKNTHVKYESCRM